MLSKEEVLHIAKLARLELTETEIPKMQKDLSAILDYFTLLKKVKVIKVKGESKNVTNIEKVTRKDRAESRLASIANNLVGAAPDKQDGYVKVKNIF